MTYRSYRTRKPTTYATQKEQADSRQVPNNAGGYSFTVDDMTRLKRFLVLGAVGGTYYVNEHRLVAENALAVRQLLSTGKGGDVVREIVNTSKAGRAPSNDPALFALAMAGAVGDLETRRAAYAALPDVARTGTHLLHFMQYESQFRGGGRIHRRALKSWFNDKPADALAYQMVKYQSRDGWSMRDVLRQVRPKAPDYAHEVLYHWAVKGMEVNALPTHPFGAPLLPWAFERAKISTSTEEVVHLIREYGLPREAIPTEMLNCSEVWEALLERMGLEALMRNLATMTKNGTLKPMSDLTFGVVGRLRDQEAIKRARLHPVKLLAALTTYQSGKSVRGDAVWTPIREIVDALNDAFYMSFDNVDPTNKKILLAIDVSGSMHGTLVHGIPNMSAYQGAAAMAMVIARKEPRYHIIAFDMEPYDLTIGPAQRLDNVVRDISYYDGRHSEVQYRGGGGTNTAVPFEYAAERGLDFDAIVTLSDSETWAGSRHPYQMLNAYRSQVGHAVKAVNVQMAATQVSNLDPTDYNSMEAIGFDTNVPELISAFVRGEF